MLEGLAALVHEDEGPAAPRLLRCLTLVLLVTTCSVAMGQGTTAIGANPAPEASRTTASHTTPPPLPVPSTVRLQEAIPYASGAAADPLRHVLDLYLPKGIRDFPTVVFVHGGGYQRGDRSVGHNLGVVLANHGVAVASISYRLFPQVKHPGQIQDVAKAFTWIKTHIAQYGGDPSRVYVSGHSAGGHLAALLGTDGTYLAAESLKPADIAGVLAISGGYRINPIRKDVFGDEAGMAAASPLAHISGDHPPFLLLYGSLEGPDRRSLSLEFRDALIAAHGKADCIEIPDRNHQGLLDQIAEGDPTADALLRAVDGRQTTY